MNDDRSLESFIDQPNLIEEAPQKHRKISEQTFQEIPSQNNTSESDKSKKIKASRRRSLSKDILSRGLRIKLSQNAKDLSRLLDSFSKDLRQGNTLLYSIIYPYNLV